MAIRWRSVALPPEHGSWGFLLEPILLGLLSAPSWGGGGIALGMFGLFLLRWSSKVWLTSRRQKRIERSQLALRFCLFYVLLMGVGFGVALWLSGLQPLLFLLLAVPFGVLFAWYDWQNQSRSWQAELLGPVTFAVTAVSVALAGGLSVGVALSLWLLLICRAVPSVLYVRARIRLEKGKAYQFRLVQVSHLGALIVIAIGWGWGWFSALTLAVFALLGMRAVVGLSEYRREVSIKLIGMAELFWGVLLVLVVGLL